MTRAALYLRMSKDRTGEGLGVDRQRDACRELCEARGWTIAGEYVDNDISAYSGKTRPRYNALLDAVDAGEFDIVVCYHVDRLYRRLVDLETIVARFNNAGVTLATVTGDYDLSNDVGRLIARILGSVAQGEQERKSARQRDAFAQSAKRGLPHGGPRAFGYTPSKLELVPDEAAAVERMYRDFVAGRASGAIARDLNEQGFTTPRGNKWAHNSVATVLANPRNAGLRGIRKKAGSYWHDIVGPGQWPAIVPEETWKAACDILQDPARKDNHTGNKQRYLLSGLATCGECGEKLITGRRDGVRLLRCPSLTHVSRKAEPIEEHVTATLLAILRRPDALEAFSAVEDTGVDVPALRDEIAALRARETAIAEAWADGTMPRPAWLAAQQKITARVEEVNAQISAAGREDIVTKVLGAGADPGEWWESAPVDLQRALLRAVVTVRVLRGKSGRPGGRRLDPETVELAPV